MNGADARQAPPSVDAHLHAAWEHLGARRWADALAALDGVDAPDRPGAAGRVRAFRAQALEGLGRLDEAAEEAMAALRLAKRTDDEAGVLALRALHQRIVGSLAALRTAARARDDDRGLADEPLDALLSRADDAGRAALLVRRANVLVDAGRIPEALESIELAVSHARRAGDPREEVFARLCAARATPAEARHILAEAHAVADASDDHNLIAAVARAATAAGVRLAAPEW